MNTIVQYQFYYFTHLYYCINNLPWVPVSKIDAVCDLRMRKNREEARPQAAHTTDHAEPQSDAVHNPMAGVLGNWGGIATEANEGATRVDLFLCMRVQALVLVRVLVRG